MKKALLIVCLAAVLSASNVANNYYISANSSDLLIENSKFPFSEEIGEDSNDGDSISQKSNVITKLSDEEIAKLNSKKCGYGQGLRLDENNRPYCALDFNAEFEKYDSYAIKDEENTIYLTFDQGYENGYTSKILDTLKDKKIKATFFVIDDYAKRNPELVQRMIDEGHTIGNHSVHHYSMPSLDVDTAKKEIFELHDYMKKEFNYEMSLFRPPMGEFSEKSLAITQACNYKTILWSFAYADWDPAKQMNPEKALEKVTKAAHGGCIYLLHSVSETNAEILPDLIDNLKAEGYKFKVIQ